MILTRMDLTLWHIVKAYFGACMENAQLSEIIWLWRKIILKDKIRKVSKFVKINHVHDLAIAYSENWFQRLKIDAMLI